MTKIIEIFKADTTLKQPLPLYLSRIKAGFPSPAEGYLDKKLDLNEHLIKHPKDQNMTKQFQNWLTTINLLKYILIFGVLFIQVNLFKTIKKRVNQ